MKNLRHIKLVIFYSALCNFSSLAPKFINPYPTKLPYSPKFSAYSEDFSLNILPHTILEVWVVHAVFFDLFSLIFKFNMYIKLKNYFILGKGRGVRNWQNIQNLFMFQMKQRLHWNHVPYHHWTYQLNPVIHQALFPNQENQLSK